MRIWGKYVRCHENVFCFFFKAVIYIYICISVSFSHIAHRSLKTRIRLTSYRIFSLVCFYLRIWRYYIHLGQECLSLGSAKITEAWVRMGVTNRCLSQHRVALTACFKRSGQNLTARLLSNNNWTMTLSWKNATF